MTPETCSQCGEAVVEGRLNCIKCGALYPDLGDKELTWDPTEEDKAE
jgi:hypothetical protein